MGNEINITVDWLMNKNHVSELNFNFFNKEKELIGYIDIDATGNMKWQIVNLAYKDYFFNILPYLYVGDINNHISYESTSPNGLRWTRARIFIVNNRLFINYGNIQEEKGKTR